VLPDESGKLSERKTSEALYPVYFVDAARAPLNGRMESLEDGSNAGRKAGHQCCDVLIGN
jgi:hypothetical protein